MAESKWIATLEFRWFVRAYTRRFVGGGSAPSKTTLEKTISGTVHYSGSVPVLQQLWAEHAMNYQGEWRKNSKTEWRDVPLAYESSEDAEARVAALNAARKTQP